MEPLTPGTDTQSSLRSLPILLVLPRIRLQSPLGKQNFRGGSTKKNKVGNFEEAELDSMKTDIERERVVLRNTNNMLGETPTQDDIDNYTAMEKRFNAKVARFNSLLDRHHNSDAEI